MSASKERLHELLLQKQEMMKYDKLRNFDPYQWQQNFLNSHASEIALRAANQIGKCNSSSTHIDTTEGKKKLSEIFGKPCTVIDSEGTPQKVLNWVKKPAEECFRITMSDGQWVECPRGHRILCENGEYFAISQIFSFLLQSPSHVQNSLLTHVSGVGRLIQKAVNYLDDYSANSSLCDEQLLFDQEGVQVFSPLPDDAQEHIGFLSRLGVLACRYTSNLLQIFDRLSSLCVCPQILGRFFLRLSPSYAYADLSLNGHNQNVRQFSTTEYRHQPSDVLQNHQSLDYEHTPYLSPVVTNETKIISIISVGSKALYDMEVEGTHCYRAGGLVHHNTLSGTAWDAMDLTGLYPEWYTGIKYDHPIILVAGCVNNDKTRDILQKELFGDPIEWEEELGTGWIPKHCIGKIQKKRGVPDAFYHVRIKHHTNGKFDGWSKVTFLAYEMGGATWMAHKADVTHLDEESPMDILQQAARSGIATGGRIRMTFTPENGVTDVVKLVENDYELHTAEWCNVAGTDFIYTTKSGKEYPFKSVKTLKGRDGHLTADKIRSAAKKIPEHDLDKRMRGIPVLGSGLVFRFPEEQFKIEERNFPDHFLYLDGIDFGGISSTAHPTAYARAAYDPINDKIIIYDGFKLQGKEIPEVASHIVMKPNSDVVPVVWPHDGHKEVAAGLTTSNKYKVAGVNMYTNNALPEKSHATHPPIDTQKEGQGGNKITPGIDEMSLRMNDGRLVVVDTLTDFWEEYRGYHMKDGKIVDRDDDFIAAVRYIVMMIRHAVTLVRVHKKLNMLPTAGWLS